MTRSTIAHVLLAVSLAGTFTPVLPHRLATTTQAPQPIQRPTPRPYPPL